MSDAPFISLPATRSAWLDKANREFRMDGSAPVGAPRWREEVRRLLAEHTTATGGDIVVIALRFNVPVTTLRTLLAGHQAPTSLQVEEAAQALRKAGIVAVVVEDL